MDTDAIIGDRVRTLRRRLGMEQQQLAALAGIGQSTMSSLEAGVRPWTVARLAAVARALGIQPAALVPEVDTQGKVSAA